MTHRTGSPVGAAAESTETFVYGMVPDLRIGKPDAARGFGAIPWQVIGLQLEQATADKPMTDRTLCADGLATYGRDFHVPLGPPANTAPQEAQNRQPPTRYTADSNWREGA